MNIDNYFSERGVVKFIEGYCQQSEEQVKDLKELTSVDAATSMTNVGNELNILEIGFHAGHSADVFLSNNPNLKMISFEIGTYDYVSIGKEYIDNQYPNRHRLIIGDSTKSVPKYIEDNIHASFDLIFIDGGHDYNVAKQDLKNCIKLANKDTIIVMDDIMRKNEWKRPWTRGPTTVWEEFIAFNKIKEIASKEYYPGKGMAWGRVK